MPTTPSTATNYSTDRQFGIELEFKGSAYEANARLNAAGIASEVESYNHTTRDRFKFVYDGSVSTNLNVGGELVSPILRGEAGIETAKAAAKALSNGAKVDQSCGFHVHIDVSDFTLFNFKNLAKIWLKFEDVMEFTIAKSRRGSARYCASNLQNFRSYRDSDSSLSPAANQCKMDCAALVRAFAAIDACTTIEQIVELFPGRYWKMNLRSFFRHQTVEFRLHQGTVNATKVEMWVRLMNYIVMSAKSTRGKVAPRKDDGKTGIGRLRSLFYGGRDAHVCAYFIKRAKVLAAA
jgi:hypothetical protein